MAGTGQSVKVTYRSIQTHSRIEHEYFYSNYDLPFFTQNHFQEMLNYVGLEYDQKYIDNQRIRRAMGKPRLFTSDFINE